VRMATNAREAGRVGSQEELEGAEPTWKVLEGSSSSQLGTSVADALTKSLRMPDFFEDKLTARMGTCS
jgi:hypothetical protein